MKKLRPFQKILLIGFFLIMGMMALKLSIFVSSFGFSGFSSPSVVKGTAYGIIFVGFLIGLFAICRFIYKSGPQMALLFMVGMFTFVALDIFLRMGVQYFPEGTLRFSPHVIPNLRAYGVSLDGWRIKKEGYSHFRPNSIGFWGVGKRADSDFVNVFQTDENGFKNPPGIYSENNQIDIITVGDSFTEGLGTAIPDSWPMVLGQLTGQSVYNLGGGGNGPQEELTLLKKFGLPKNPKFVLWGFLEGNDLEDAVHWETAQKNDATDSNSILTTIANWVDGWPSLDLPFALLRQYRYVRSNNPEANPQFITYQTARGSEIVPYNYYDKNMAELISYRGTEIMRDSLSQAKHAIEDQGGKFIVVAFPNKGHVYFSHLNEKQINQLGELANNIYLKNQLIHSICDELDIPIIDITPTFLSLKDPHHFYFQVDGHMNAKGNRLVAETIAHQIPKKETVQELARVP